MRSASARVAALLIFTMAKIYNSELSKELREGGKLQVIDKMPDELADKVVPVMEVNPKLLKQINLIKSSTSNGTIFTTDANKDTYLCAAMLTASGTATAANRISVTPFGQSSAVDILGVDIRVSVALDVSNGSNNIALPYPIKLARGSAVTLTTTATSARAAVFCYEEENINA